VEKAVRTWSQHAWIGTPSTVQQLVEDVEKALERLSTATAAGTTHIEATETGEEGVTLVGDLASTLGRMSVPHIGMIRIVGQRRSKSSQIVINLASDSGVQVTVSSDDSAWATDTMDALIKRCASGLPSHTPRMLYSPAGAALLSLIATVTAAKALWDPYKNLGDERYRNLLVDAAKPNAIEELIYSTRSEVIVRIYDDLSVLIFFMFWLLVLTSSFRASASLLTWFFPRLEIQASGHMPRTTQRLLILVALFGALPVIAVGSWLAG